MKSWQQYGNLFVENFYAKVNDQIMPIIGFADSHINNLHGDCFILRNQSKQHVYKFISECQLIARKIENITDKELIEYYNSYSVGMGNEYKSTLGFSIMRGMILDDRKSSEQLLYLLSIGVCTFPWDETVIDRKTLNL